MIRSDDSNKNNGNQFNDKFHKRKEISANIN